MILNADLREFIGLLNSHGVEYVIVGAHCLAFHARPRYTGDLDIFVRPTADNAERLVTALRAFGFGSIAEDAAAFTEPEQVIQLGRAPNRIDLLTSLTGVTADESFATKVPAELGGLPVFVLAKELLLKNKRATGRPQDLADVVLLASPTEDDGP
jgi:hypothetical protein